MSCAGLTMAVSDLRSVKPIWGHWDNGRLTSGHKKSSDRFPSVVYDKESMKMVINEETVRGMSIVCFCRVSFNVSDHRPEPGTG